MGDPVSIPVTQIRGVATGEHRCSLGRGWYLDSRESAPSLPDFTSLWLAGRRSDHWDQWGKHEGHDARQSDRADQIRRKTSEAVAEAGNRTSPRVRCVPHSPSPVFFSSHVLQTCRLPVFFFNIKPRLSSTATWIGVYCRQTDKHTCQLKPQMYVCEPLL